MYFICSLSTEKFSEEEDGSAKHFECKCLRGAVRVISRGHSGGTRITR